MGQPSIHSPTHAVTYVAVLELMDPAIRHRQGCTAGFHFDSSTIVQSKGDCGGPGTALEV